MVYKNKEVLTLDPLNTLGTLLAVGGTVISVVGVYYNNVRKQHHRAMQWWMYSNIALSAWAIGNLCEVWDGGLSIAALAVLYLIFTATNLYGLMKK